MFSATATYKKCKLRNRTHQYDRVGYTTDNQSQGLKEASPSVATDLQGCNLRALCNDTESLLNEKNGLLAIGRQPRTVHATN